MAKITFKAKAGILHREFSTTSEYKIPKLERRHCDMEAFRSHPKYGGLANSDLFCGLINNLVRKLYPSGYVRSDDLADGTSIESGYLAKVTIDV